MGSPHALVLPYPAQGHVIPLMELSHRLVDLGFTVTFVTTEHTHRQLLAAFPEPSTTTAGPDRLRVVAVPDGLAPDDDRADLGCLTAAVLRAMPGHLEELIRETTESAGDGGGRITCVVADQGMAWVLGVAGKMGIRTAAFWPGSAGMLATMLSIPKLVEDGIIDPEGKLYSSMDSARWMVERSNFFMIWGEICTWFLQGAPGPRGSSGSPRGCPP